MADEKDGLEENSCISLAPASQETVRTSFLEQLLCTEASSSKPEDEIVANIYVGVEEIKEEDPFESMVAEGLSQLGRSADGTMQVFLSLSLQQKDLCSVEGISSYTHLQVLDLSYNKLEDLSPLSSLHYLISLDASHNELSMVLDFEPPLSLREVNLSNNKIEQMSDLSGHKSLNKLILDNNFIKEINGLEQCKRLKILSIANNHIEKINGIERLPLTYLDLSKNKLKRIENIGSLAYLQVLDLSFNSIRSLRGLQSHDLLDTIKLYNNEIIDLSEVRYIRDLPLLRVLDFSYNPLQDFPDYRLSIVFRIPCLQELDNTPVLPEEKVASQNLFKPRRDIIAARNHMINLMRSYQQPIKLFNSTLSSTETPYPMLILTGPSGSGKRTLIKKLCQEFPNFFGQGVSYTTRGLRENEKVPRESEVDGIDYHFITKEDFERDALAGKFISTCNLYNNQYGISRETIEAVAKEGLACVFHMELEGVMVFKNTHFEPRYVLILPESEKAHEDRMKSRTFYNDSHISQAMERVGVYEEMNREHPGYFDMVITCDDIEESYKQLKKIVLEYLGMSPVNSSVSNFSTSTRESEISETSSTDMTRSASTPYEKESLAASPVKPWRKNRAVSGGLESIHSPGLTRPGKSPVEAASIQRRFKKIKAATTGITSTSEEQLSKLRPPLSATGIADSWAYEDVSASLSNKRASSAPYGPISSYTEPGMELDESGPPREEETDSERGSDESDMSSAHAGYDVDENEDGESVDENEDQRTSYSTSRTSIPSVLS